MNDLEAAAEHALLTAQIRSFVPWVGSGCKLTHTGRIGLADARHLVELLSTGDTIDPKIGDRVFKTKSSEELAHLIRIVEWAKAARLVRVSGTRLVPVKKNATLPGRPLDLVTAMFAAYPKLGRLTHLGLLRPVRVLAYRRACAPAAVGLAGAFRQGSGGGFGKQIMLTGRGR